ncbi:uncharacterized protein YggL (DUF469 family) [Heliophilum fasciatum]|nr:uncharacterized protein YggL (DUF469 family) [Heliophilum fasciatum]
MEARTDKTMDHITRELRAEVKLGVAGGNRYLQTKVLVQAR